MLVAFVTHIIDNYTVSTYAHLFDTAQETLFPISGDNLMSSVISLASVSGTLLLILTLATIVILALLRLHREKPESTYDKL